MFHYTVPTPSRHPYIDISGGHRETLQTYDMTLMSSDNRRESVDNTEYDKDFGHTNSARGLSTVSVRAFWQGVDIGSIHAVSIGLYEAL